MMGRTSKADRQLTESMRPVFEEIMLRRVRAGLLIVDGDAYAFTDAGKKLIGDDPEQWRLSAGPWFHGLPNDAFWGVVA
jgi:hypothetical protein